MAAIPQSALAVHKVRDNNERAVSMSVKGEKGKTEERKENIFNSRPYLKGIILAQFFLIHKFNLCNQKEALPPSSPLPPPLRALT